MKSRTAVVLFAGAGGLTLGLQRAGFRVVGAVDNDRDSCDSHLYLTGVKPVCRDIETMTPADFRTAFGDRAPDVLATSPPCRGFSACLPKALAETPFYQQLNNLALLGIWLALEAWKKPPKLILLENVPRIRGSEWINHAIGLLRHYGYAVTESVHDCGELGGLAQRRRRYLLVARHVEQCPAFLFEPPKKPLRGVGEVVGQLPVPSPGRSAETGGPLHELGQMYPINWVRLALIPAGKDWRALPERVALEERKGRHNGGFGVNAWGGAAHTVVARPDVASTWRSIADPRLGGEPYNGVYGAIAADSPSGVITASTRPINGRFSYADPRINKARHEGAEGVKGWADYSTTIIANGSHHNGPWQFADRRVEVGLNHKPRRGSFGVRDWATPTHTVIASVQNDKGYSVADPRIPAIVALGGAQPIDILSKKAIHLVIVALDNTWHRPFTVLELALLQGLPAEVDGAPLALKGTTKASWCKQIGNMVPPPTAEAYGRQAQKTLDASECGGFHLGSTPVWVERRAL